MPTTLAGEWWGTDNAIYDEEIGLTVNEHGETYIEADAHDLPGAQPDRRAVALCWCGHLNSYPYRAGQPILIDGHGYSEHHFRKLIIYGRLVDARCAACGKKPLIPRNLEML